MNIIRAIIVFMYNIPTNAVNRKRYNILIYYNLIVVQCIT